MLNFTIEFTWEIKHGCKNFLLFQASYGVEDPEYAVTQLAQTTMRSELGKLTLDKVFRVGQDPLCCLVSECIPLNGPQTST